MATASTPGLMYYFPWESWGHFKYLLYVPLMSKAWYDRAVLAIPLVYSMNVFILVLLVTRYLLFQGWGTVSRLPYFSRKYQIQTKGIKFEQIDHEASWENMLLTTTNLLWLGAQIVVPAKGLPLWDWKGLPVALLVHAGPVEWLYYWGHRALHHHYLFTRYHQHHHSSFVPQPITSSNHPFLEMMFYHTLFALPIFATLGAGCCSKGIIYFYILFVDFMNAWGHCNFEFIPTWAFEKIRPLKYIIYSSSYHSLHHSKVHTNFCLFMPLYDYVYGTVDATSDILRKDVRKRGSQQTKVDGVYLTHVNDLLSVFHLQAGFQTFAAQPYSNKWYIRMLWPPAVTLMLLAWLFAKPFVGATHFFGSKLELQTWVIPRFSFQYQLSSEAATINGWIQECIVQAKQAGAKVIALALHNKDRNLNIDNVLMAVEDAGIAIVTGDTLAAGIVAKKIQNEHSVNESKVFVTSAGSRVGRAIAVYLCEHGFRVLARLSSKELAEDLRMTIAPEFQDNLFHVKDYVASKTCKVWIVSDEVERNVQKMAPKGTHFYQCGTFLVNKWRKDCFYSGIPALRLPLDAQNINACEDVMPRYVVRTGYAAAMLHIRASLNYQEYGGDIPMERMLESYELALKHGFCVEY